MSIICPPKVVVAEAVVVEAVVAEAELVAVVAEVVRDVFHEMMLVVNAPEHRLMLPRCGRVVVGSKSQDTAKARVPPVCGVVAAGTRGAVREQLQEQWPQQYKLVGAATSKSVKVVALMDRMSQWDVGGHNRE